MAEPTPRTEIEVELANEPGTLADVTELLGNENVNILGFTCEAAGETGTACFIPDDPRQALTALEGSGYEARQTEVLFMPIPNRPGELGKMARKLGDQGINIKRSFVAADPDSDTFGIGVEVDDIKKAAQTLQG